MAELDLELKIEDTKQIHDKLLKIVCLVCNVTEKDLKSKKRHRNIVDSRVLYVFLLNKYTSYNKSRMGMFINRDHATVIYYLKNHERFIDTDFEYKMMYNQCEALVKEKMNLYDFSNQLTYIESLNKEIDFLKSKYLEYKDKYDILTYKYEKLCNIINN
jgi:hypothetical protein